jgi:hypothetical protein
MVRRRLRYKKDLRYPRFSRTRCIHPLATSSEIFRVFQLVPRRHCPRHLPVRDPDRALRWLVNSMLLGRALRAFKPTDLLIFSATSRFHHGILRRSLVRRIIPQRSATASETGLHLLKAASPRAIRTCLCQRRNRADRSASSATSRFHYGPLCRPSSRILPVLPAMAAGPLLRQAPCRETKDRPCSIRLRRLHRSFHPAIQIPPPAPKAC